MGTESATATDEEPRPSGDTTERRQRPLASKWQIAIAVLGGLTVITTSALAYQLFELHAAVNLDSERTLARIEATTAELKKVNAPPTLTPIAKVAHYCNAWMTEFKCTFTNRTDDRIATCAVGRLTRKDNPARALESAVLCSGSLGPNETRTVSAPWLAGSAEDLCFSKSSWGNVVLDWKICAFDVDGTREAQGAKP